MSITLSQMKDRDRVLLVEKGRLHPAVSFTRASTATYFNGAGVLVTAAINTPRFAYDGSGNYLGLLIEEARTNLLLNSDGTLAQLSAYSAVTNATTALAPYFTNSIQFPTSGGSNYAYKTISYNVGTYVVSCFIKMDDGSFPVVSSSNSTGDLSLVVNGNIASSVPTITYVGGGVYRISAYVVVSTARTSFAGVVQYSTQSRKGFRVTGLQVELGTVPSSYIPTTTATVTRSGDVCKVTTLSNIRFNAAEGSFVCKAVQGKWAASQQTYFSLYGVAGTHIQVRRETKTTVNLALIFDASVAQSSFSKTAGDDGLSVKMAMGYKLNDIVGSANGLAVSTDTSATIPTVTTLEVGSFTGGNPMNGYIEYLAYYPKKRPNADYPRMSV